MIELKNIQVSAGNFTLHIGAVQFEQGKFHVLLGPTGSGKTILLETIAGLIKPKNGSILFNNKDVTPSPPENRKIAYLPQDNSLFPHKNVYENIAFGLRLKKGWSEEEIGQRISQIAAMLNIGPLLDRGVRHLSGGEQQRVALARVLTLENPYLLMDEPTSSLHETMQESFCLLLKDIQKKFSLTVLMTTHHKDSAFLLADQLHFIEGGKLLLSIETAKLSSAPLPIPIQVAELLGITNIINLQKLDDKQNTYYCPELNADLILTSILHKAEGSKLQLAVKPIDIRVIKAEEKHISHINIFNAHVEKILYKESDALVFLKIPDTAFSLKMELSVYNLNKLNIREGVNIDCKIKEEHSRIVY